MGKVPSSCLVLLKKFFRGFGRVWFPNQLIPVELASLEASVFHLSLRCQSTSQIFGVKKADKFCHENTISIGYR
jgi:hypothetical protein